jgi:hypothetical protein
MRRLSGVRSGADKVPWAEPRSRFTMLVEPLLIDVIQACRNVKAACTLVGITMGSAVASPQGSSGPRVGTQASHRSCEHRS